MNVILSIKPEYCRKIKNGNKRYEFRKRIFKNQDGVHRVFMYATCPVQKIVGAFTIESVIEGDPESLWERFKDFSGIEKHNFFKYFGSTEKGFAIKIKEVEAFTPIEPKKVVPDFFPPQSFRYIKNQKWIDSLKTSE